MSSGIEDRFGVNGGRLFVPMDYVSGSTIAFINSYEDETFASLGVTPCTYVWSWGSGDNADTFTLKIIPAAGAGALLGMGGLLADRRRR